MEKKDLLVVKNIKISILDIFIFAITFGILIFSLLAYYPGIMTSDSASQWEQLNTNIYKTWHPIFHTLFIKVVTLIWNSPAAVAILQSFIYSLLITLICRLSRKGNNKFWVGATQCAIAVCLFIIPVNFTYPITLWKDIIYSFALFGILYFILKGVENKFEYKLWEKIVIAIVLASISLFRYNGIIASLFIIVVFLVYNIIKKNFKEYLKFICMFVVAYIVLSLPSNFVNKVEGEQRYKSGIFIHMTGALLNDDKITDAEDLEFLNTIYDVDLWKEKYTPFTHDTIMFEKELKSNDKYIVQNAGRLKNIVIKYALKNPFTIIKHYYYLTAITWQIVPFESNYYSFVNISETQGNPDYLETLSNSKVPKVKELYKGYTEFTCYNFYLRTLFYRPALHLYITIIMIIVLVILKKDKRYFFALIPLLGNTLSMIPALPAQDFRYFYINLLTMIAVGIVLATEIIKKCYENSKFRSGFLYLVFGALTTVINIATYFVCTNILNLNYIIANCIAWILAVVVAFITNKLYVFDSKSQNMNVVIKEIGGFVSARIMTLFMETLVLALMLNVMHIGEGISKVFSNILVLIVNYILSKYIIFKKKEEK